MTNALKLVQLDEAHHGTNLGEVEMLEERARKRGLSVVLVVAGGQLAGAGALLVLVGLVGPVHPQQGVPLAVRVAVGGAGEAVAVAGRGAVGLL